MDYSALTKSNTLENAWNGRNMWTVNNGWVVILVKYGFIRLLQRLFNCDKMHDISVTYRWSTEQFGIWITFLRHHIHELQIVKNCQDFHCLYKLVFSAQYGFSLPRIFKYDDIPNISFTPDKELNILIYRSPYLLI